MIKFESAKHPIFLVFLWIIVLFLFGIAVVNLVNIIASLVTNSGNSVSEWLVPLLITSTIGTFFLRMLIDTNYKIDESFLYCKSGFLNIKIEISKIRKLEENNDFVKNTIFKPSLSQKGFYIHYDKYESIFISPENKVLFIETLKSKNPNIEIT